MKLLCIVLSSSYPTHLPRFFNEEIHQDLAVIKSTLHDHHFFEIILPCTSKKLTRTNILKKNLNLLDIPPDTHCHIVLNTHGKPGSSDIKHDCIIYLLNYLSEMKATITQISGLQCEGMKAAEFSAEARLSHRTTMADTPIKISRKPADLVNLQKKLNALSLDTAQHFMIRGFEHAYEPLKSVTEVQGLLQGRIGIALAVSIPSKTYDFEKIIANLNMIQKAYDLSKTALQELSNFFGKIIHHIKQKLFVTLRSNTKISTYSAELEPLLNALCTQGKMSESDFCRTSDEKKEEIYRNWLRKYKLNSSERQAVLLQFAVKSIEKQTELAPRMMT